MEKIKVSYVSAFINCVCAATAMLMPPGEWVITMVIFGVLLGSSIVGTFAAAKGV